MYESIPPMKYLLQLAGVIAAVGGGSAHAQSVNYDDLQKAFGEPITTSVTGAPQRASEAAASLIVITREDIARAPARDIPGILATYAGIDVANWTQGDSEVYVRGGVRPLNVLIDGHQVYLDVYGETFWNLIGVQVDDIQQIEVIKGPNSALFGYNAASGVINIITVDPLHRQDASATVEVGNAGHLKGSLSLARKFGNLIGVHLSGGYERDDEFAYLRDQAVSMSGSRPINPYHADVAGGISIKPGDETEIGLTGNYTRAVSTDYPIDLGYFRAAVTTESIGFHASRDMGWGLISVKSYRNWMTLEGELDNRGITLKDAFRSQVSVASAEMLFRAGKSNTIRVGTEYRVSELMVNPGFSGKTQLSTYSGSVMWQSDLTNALNFTLAGRGDQIAQSQQGVTGPTLFTADQYNRSLHTWSFNGALQWKVGARSSLRLSAGRGVMIPSLIDIGLHITIPNPSGIPFVISGNPVLQPTIAWNGEINFVRQLPSIGAHISLTGFYSRYDDLLKEPDPSRPTLFPPAYPFFASVIGNIGSMASYGLEAEAVGAFGAAWHWNLNYTWNKVHADLTGASPNLLYNFNTSTPRHKINALLSYDHGPWILSTGLRLISSTEQVMRPTGVAMLTRVNGIASFNGKIARQLGPRLTLSLTIENLTDAGRLFVTPRRISVGLRAHF